jgi:hypothetical protein
MKSEFVGQRTQAGAAPCSADASILPRPPPNSIWVAVAHQADQLGELDRRSPPLLNAP